MRTHCDVSVRILSLISSWPVMVSADTSTTTGPISRDTLPSLTSKFPPKVSSLFAVIVPLMVSSLLLPSEHGALQRSTTSNFALRAKRADQQTPQSFLLHTATFAVLAVTRPNLQSFFFCSPRSCVKKTLSVLGWFVWSIKAGSPAGTSRHSTKGFSPSSKYRNQNVRMRMA